jgi:hypothetical protein
MKGWPPVPSPVTVLSATADGADEPGGANEAGRVDGDSGGVDISENTPCV